MTSSHKYQVGEQHQRACLGRHTRQLIPEGQVPRLSVAMDAASYNGEPTEVLAATIPAVPISCFLPVQVQPLYEHTAGPLSVRARATMGYVAQQCGQNKGRAQGPQPQEKCQVNDSNDFVVRVVSKDSFCTG
jgi:hypothetical protein